MSVVLCANSVKLHPDVDRRFTDSVTPSLRIYQEKHYFLANLSRQSIVGVSLFVLAMIMSKNCSCLVNISDDLDESSSDVDSRV